MNKEPGVIKTMDWRRRETQKMTQGKSAREGDAVCFFFPFTQEVDKIFEEGC